MRHLKNQTSLKKRQACVGTVECLNAINCITGLLFISLQESKTDFIVVHGDTILRGEYYIGFQPYWLPTRLFIKHATADTVGILKYFSPSYINAVGDEYDSYQQIFILANTYLTDWISFLQLRDHCNGKWYDIFMILF